MEWISVNERLPENQDWVLAAIEGVGVLTEMASYCNGCVDGTDCLFTGWSTSCGSREETRITHWMPIPEAPGTDKSISDNLQSLDENKTTWKAKSTE